MENSLKNDSVFKLLFEKVSERIALIETDGENEKFFVSGILPNPALVKLLGLNDQTISEQAPLDIFLAIFPKNVIRDIEHDCFKVRKLVHLQKEYVSRKEDKTYRFDYSNLSTNTVALLIEDISEDKRIRNDKKAFEKSDGLKNAFIANISHEIRTPLNSIIGFTGMLLDSMQDEGDRKIIQTIQKSGKQLLHLINDIVDLSKIEEGEISIYKSPVNLGMFMDNIKQQFEGYRRNEYKHDVYFYLEIPGFLRKKIVLLDEHRLHQVLSNLLSNAFKFTFEGEILLSVKKEKDRLIFSVKDTGIGISREDQKIIFERFKQSGSQRTIEKRGTGLGLTISKGLIKLMAGEMWLESEENKGSAFYFSIPMEETAMDSETEKEHSDERKTAPDLSGKLILIAEDDPYSLEMISFLVKATGAEVIFADDGEQALDLFKSNKCDLALLDIRLPKITGYDLVKRMKSLDPEIIVVAQTAYALSEDIRTFREKGFDEYLTKPINPELLYDVLRKYLL